MCVWPASLHTQYNSKHSQWHRDSVDYIDSMFRWEPIFFYFRMISSHSQCNLLIDYFKQNLSNQWSIDEIHFSRNLNKLCAKYYHNSTKINFDRFISRDLKRFFVVKSQSKAWNLIAWKWLWNRLDRRALSNHRQCQTRIGCLRQYGIVCTNF